MFSHEYVIITILAKNKKKQIHLGQYVANDL